LHFYTNILLPVFLQENIGEINTANNTSNTNSINNSNSDNDNNSNKSTDRKRPLSSRRITKPSLDKFLSDNFNFESEDEDVVVDGSIEEFAAVKDSGMDNYG
jgi:hypothetical protein